MSETESVSGPQVSGVGSWPTVSAREAIRTVRDLLVGAGGIPYLPEIPGRGPGADMVGRGASLLVELPTELTPNGWRIAPGVGREMRRATAYWREDVEQLAEAYEGYVGPLKTQVIGPWTLAAALELPRGEKVVSDLGAVRDLVQSLRAGLAQHIADLRRLVPGADVIVQVDEPALPAVLAGHIPSASKLRRLPAIEAGLVQDTLRNDVHPLHAADVRVVFHSCAPDVPLDVVRRSGVDGLAVDTSLVQAGQYEALGEALDSGVQLWAGVVPTQTSQTHPGAFVERFRQLLDRVGFGLDATDHIVVTPACGLAGTSAPEAVRLQRLCQDVAAMLRDQR